MKSNGKRLAWAGLALLFCVGYVGCSVNPVTGERQLALISEEQEIQLGQQAAEQVSQSMALVDDAELQAYVERIGKRLAADSERPDLPWSFAIVDDPTPNAFALPGGPIFVTRGMLTLMDSEAELASVLGHEIGHITARHSVAQLSRAQLAQLGLGLGSIFVPEFQRFGDLAGAGLSLLLLKYGRDAERQADDLGFRYARTHGYDVNEMADVFASLQRAGEMAGQSAIPSWLATHPAPEERVEAVEARIEKLPQDQFDATVGRREFLRVIEGLAYGENPRNGFFRENVFYHPELAFRFSVPAEWQRQNLARAVIGVSPREDAAFQFTLAGEADPGAALQRFASQQQLRLEATNRESINGISAAVAGFQAQTEQGGAVAGYVAAFAHDGQTYQLVTYTPAQAFAQYRDTFQQMIRSFAPLDDPTIRNIQAPRLEIVELPRAMSLRQFADWSGSSIDLEELALINQIRDLDATIEAGTQLKRVRGDVVSMPG